MRFIDAVAEVYAGMAVPVRVVDEIQVSAITLPDEETIYLAPEPGGETFRSGIGRMVMQYTETVRVLYVPPVGPLDRERIRRVMDAVPLTPLPGDWICVDASRESFDERTSYARYGRSMVPFTLDGMGAYPRMT